MPQRTVDRRRFVASVVRRVLRQDDRAVYVHDRVDAHELVGDLADSDEAVGTALGRGQLVVRSPRIHAVERTFDIDFLLGWCGARTRLVGSQADGYEGLTLIVEAGASMADAQGLGDYEQRLNAVGDSDNRDLVHLRSREVRAVIRRGARTGGGRRPGMGGRGRHPTGGTERRRRAG